MHVEDSVQCTDAKKLMNKTQDHCVDSSWVCWPLRETQKALKSRWSASKDLICMYMCPLFKKPELYQAARYRLPFFFTEPSIKSASCIHLRCCGWGVDWFCIICLISRFLLSNLVSQLMISGYASKSCCSWVWNFHCNLFLSNLRCTNRRAFW